MRVNGWDGGVGVGVQNGKEATQNCGSNQKTEEGGAWGDSPIPESPWLSPVQTRQMAAVAAAHVGSGGVLRERYNALQEWRVGSARQQPRYAVHQG